MQCRELSSLIVELGRETRRIVVEVPLTQVVAAVVVLHHLDMIGNGNINQSLKRENIKEEIETMILLTKRVRREDLVIQSTIVNDTKEMNINERRRINDLIDINMIGVVVVQMMIIVDIHQRRNGSMIDKRRVNLQTTSVIT